MKYSKFIEDFSRLGQILDSQLNDTGSELHLALAQAYSKNKWFTKTNTEHALRTIIGQLSSDSLTTWMGHYPMLNQASTKKIGVISAGNIPMAGFNDFLCVLASGNHYIGKLSKDDDILLPCVTKILTSLIDNSYTSQIHFVETLENMDAVIATGSNNSNRYFKHYFGKYPHIFRKNRNSVAVLNGMETNDTMRNIADDVFLYFGLGCRNISKIYIPEGYDVSHFYTAMEKYAEVIHHNKYANNYNYYRTLYAMNSKPYLDNGFLLLKEDVTLHSPVSVVNFEFYKNFSQVNQSLMFSQDEIQCVIAENRVGREIDFPGKRISPGMAQQPPLDDYADNVDVLEWLTNL